MSKNKQRIATFLATPEQREWLDKEAKRTGNSIATVIRSLIQDQLSKVANG